MIEGRINDRYEPVVTISLTAPKGETREVDAVVNTGFNGFLVLPPELVEEMEMPFLHYSRSFLADDREMTLQTHQATINWNGDARRVRAIASGSAALVGMQLLEGHRLEMDIRPGGTVQIHSL